MTGVAVERGPVYAARDVAERTEHEVWRRTQALAAVYVRARVEGGLHYSTGVSKRKWAGLGRRLLTWCASFEGFSPAEKRLMKRPLGSWAEQRQIDGIWRLEALGIMLWALSLQRTIRKWDRPYDAELLRLVDVPSWFDATPLTKRRRLRPKARLDDACDCAEVWHWRANTGNDLTPRRRDIVRDAAKAAEEQGWLAPVVGDDFPFRGRAYHLLDDDAFHEAHSIALERHVALVWLTDDSPWDAVEADT